MKRMLMSIALIVMGAGVARAADCTTPITTVEKGKLIVAAYDYPPFTFASPDGKIGGIDPDIVSRVAKENCLEVVTMVVDPAATIQAVISGRADVAIGSWYRTEKRNEVLGQSAPTYVDSMGIYSTDGIDTIEAMQGKNVGTVQGFFWVPQLQKVLGPSLKLYPTPLAMAQDLSAGRLDVAITGYNAGTYIQKNAGGYDGIQIKRVKPDERVPATMQPSQTGILFTKGNDSLQKALADSIANQHADGSILKSLKAAGFDDTTADVGEPRFVK